MAGLQDSTVHDDDDAVAAAVVDMTVVDKNEQQFMGHTVHFLNFKHKGVGQSMGPQAIQKLLNVWGRRQTQLHIVTCHVQFYTLVTWLLNFAVVVLLLPRLQLYTHEAAPTKFKMCTP